MAQDAVDSVIAGVHPDQKAGISALFQQFGITRPRMMRDPCAIGVQPIGNQRVKAPVAAGAMAVDHHDFAGSSPFGAAHSRIDFSRIKLSTFLVHGSAAGNLIPSDDAAHAFHIAHNQNFHRIIPLLTPGNASCYTCGRTIIMKNPPGQYEREGWVKRVPDHKER